MCNSYTVKQAKRKAARWAERVEAVVAAKEPGLIRPSDPGPVLLGDLSAEWMRWGFHRPWGKSINNARSDNLAGGMWGEAFEQRRCLIPASAIIEFNGPKGDKTAHEFTDPAGAWLWVAGIWEESEKFGRCYSMIMTDANVTVSIVHDRMPAILEEERALAYLAGEIREFPPSAVPLVVAKVVNPLTGKPPSSQMDLF